MKRLALYSVLVGDQEAPNPALGEIAKASGVDTYLVTDRPGDAPEGVQPLPIQDLGLGPARTSRRPKHLPWEYLPDVEWSLYIDNSVRLKRSPSEILAAAGERPGADFWLFRHPRRSCVFEEAEELIRRGYDDERRIRDQVSRYRGLGMPRDFGLHAGTVLLRRHGSEWVRHFCRDWFEQVLTHSKRDQLALDFVRWRRDADLRAFDERLDDTEWLSWPDRGPAGAIRRYDASFDPEFYRWINMRSEPPTASAGHHVVAARAKAGDVRTHPHRWDLNRLANKYRTDKGDLYYNAHGYAFAYEALLRHRQADSLRLLEIGLLRHDVQARNPGGPYDDAPSLSMWREWLPNAEIIGFDIADFSAYAAPAGVRVVRGDAGSRSDLSALADLAGRSFDVVIDDGSHASHHQQIAFDMLFPLLRPGGFYFIEDLNYQPPALERKGATKTRDIFKAAQCGRVGPTGLISRRLMRDLVDGGSDVSFHDGRGTKLGQLNADALLAIRKRSRSQTGRLARRFERLEREARRRIAEVTGRQL